MPAWTRVAYGVALAYRSDIQKGQRLLALEELEARDISWIYISGGLRKIGRGEKGCLWSKCKRYPELGNAWATPGEDRL